MNNIKHLKEMLKIHSNLSGELVIEDERYKAHLKAIEYKKKHEEEDRNKEIYGTIYPSNWMKSHKELFEKGLINGYISDPSNYYHDNGTEYMSDYCSIYFYEYSSMDGNQKKFYSRREFYRFCNDCDINVIDDIKSCIDNSYTLYITCVPGKKELMLSTSYIGLEELIKKYNRIEASKINVSV